MLNLRAAIKVFGVYTHAELDKRLWEAMGHQLLRKGREYQKRYVFSAAGGCCTPDLTFCSCTFRADPVHKGDKVVPPASFPAVLPSDPNMIPDELPAVSDDVLEEVRQNQYLVALC